MSTKRLIASVPLPGVKPGLPPTSKPEVTWIAPSELLVDETYQRNIGEKGLRLIRRIVENFDWCRFKPPTAVWTDEGLEVVDGQHSAIAAASHPSIDSIPVVVVEAAELADRASAFIGINRDRLNVTLMQIHAAGIVARDERALEVDAVCRSADVRMLKASPNGGAYKPRDTVAVGAISDLVRRRGAVAAADVMQTIAAADPAPITAAAIRAVDFLLHDPEHATVFEAVDLTKAIAALGAQADKDAAVFCAEHCVPRWRGLAAVLFKKCRKRRQRADAGTGGEGDDPSEPAPCELSLPAPFARRLTIGRALDSVTAAILGDPTPGRSALDQRRLAG